MGTRGFTTETAGAAGALGRGAPHKRDFITQHIIAELNEVDKQTGARRVRTLVKKLIEKAEEGDVPAMREVIDRVEGKAKQDVNVNHSGELTVISAAILTLAELFNEAAREGTDQPSENPRPN